MKDLIDHLQPTYILGHLGLSFVHSFNLPGFSLAFIPVLLFLTVLLIMVLFIFRLYLRTKKLAEEEAIILEITPPAHLEKTAFTTQQLFSTIHGLGIQKPWQDKLLGKRVRFSFEIVSTRSEGIRYFIRTHPKFAESFKRNLISYMSEIKIKEVEDYLLGSLKESHVKIIDYKLTKSFGHPLRKQDTLEESDPVAYITGQMTQLSDGELVSFQIILSPAETKEIDTMDYHIKNGTILEYLQQKDSPLVTKIIKGLLKMIGVFLKEILKGGLTFVQEFTLDPESVKRFRAYDLQSQMRSENLSQRELSPYEMELIGSIKEKIKQPLFDASIRFLVIAKDKNQLRDRVTGIRSSLKPFSVPSYQELKPQRSIFNLL